MNIEQYKEQFPALFNKVYAETTNNCCWDLLEDFINNSDLACNLDDFEYKNFEFSYNGSLPLDSVNEEILYPLNDELSIEGYIRYATQENLDFEP